MCGIVGFATWRTDNNLEELVSQMISPLHHRGPDDHGTWFDRQNGIALGHRRLAIVDLSEHGHQPMVSNSGRYMLVYNGEIYNFAEIKTELIKAGHVSWKGHSDTEVLLAAIDTWGIDRAIRKTRGMFAMALWDRQDKKLTLIRDRLGEKPLYYGVIQGRFVFASELKAIKAIMHNALEIDRNALAEYMRFGYVPTPGSIYEGINKLEAGHILTVDSPNYNNTPKPYWSLDTQEQADYRMLLGQSSEQELIELLHDALRNSVGLQMHSDVPLGAFLSGGVDSSTIVALMQAQSERKIKTFTIGFNEKEFDEAPYAKAVARHLGTEHTELYVTAGDAEAIVPQIPVIYDEPFADSSQIPTTLVSRLTREHVTVSLSGDGGDELFAGYPRYHLTQALWNKMNGVPHGLKKSLSVLLQGLSAQGWDRILRFLPEHRRQTFNGRRVHRLAQLMTSEDIGHMYIRLMSQWQPEEKLVKGVQKKADFNWPQTDNSIAAMRRWDVQQYLCDDLLVKVDRASMSASLESRAPLLDHRIVEMAFALPQDVLIKEGTGKWLLRQVLDKYVPRELIERPKVGFSIPLGEWLRGPLRDWAESLLAPALLAEQGLLDEQQISRLWQQHITGLYDRSTYLWNILMFQAWYFHAK